MQTHKELVLKHLKENKTITSMQAFELFGNTRLSDTIYRLKHDGYDIRTSSGSHKNRYGRSVKYAIYTLEGENK